MVKITISTELDINGKVVTSSPVGTVTESQIYDTGVNF